MQNFKQGNSGSQNGKEGPLQDKPLERRQRELLLHRFSEKAAKEFIEIIQSKKTSFSKELVSFAENKLKNESVAAALKEYDESRQFVPKGLLSAVSEQLLKENFYFYVGHINGALSYIFGPISSIANCAGTEFILLENAQSGIPNFKSAFFLLRDADQTAKRQIIAYHRGFEQDSADAASDFYALVREKKLSSFHEMLFKLVPEEIAEIQKRNLFETALKDKLNPKEFADFELDIRKLPNFSADLLLMAHFAYLASKKYTDSSEKDDFVSRAANDSAIGRFSFNTHLFLEAEFASSNPKAIFNEAFQEYVKTNQPDRSTNAFAAEIAFSPNPFLSLYKIFKETSILNKSDAIRKMLSDNPDFEAMCRVAQYITELFKSDHYVPTEERIRKSALTMLRFNYTNMLNGTEVRTINNLFDYNDSIKTKELTEKYREITGNQ